MCSGLMRFRAPSSALKQKNYHNVQLFRCHVPIRLRTFTLSVQANEGALKTTLTSFLQAISQR